MEKLITVMSSSLFILYEFLIILSPVKVIIRSLTISVLGAIETKQEIFIDIKGIKYEEMIKKEERERRKINEKVKEDMRKYNRR